MNTKKKKINYAVIGLEHVAQVAVLPAFKNSKNSVLKALVSGDSKKLEVLSTKYPQTCASQTPIVSCGK